MVLRESLGRQGSLKLVGSLEKPSPCCSALTRRAQAARVGGQGGPVIVAVPLTRLGGSCGSGSGPRAAGGPGWTSLCSPVPTAEPTLDSDLLKGEKAFSLWWHLRATCPGSSLVGWEWSLVKWDKAQVGEQRRWLFSGIGLAWVTSWGNQEETGSVCAMSVPCCSHTEAQCNVWRCFPRNQSYQITKWNTCSVYFFF